MYVFTKPLNIFILKIPWLFPSFIANFHSTFNGQDDKEHLLLCHFRISLWLMKYTSFFLRIYLVIYAIIPKNMKGHRIINISKLHFSGLEGSIEMAFAKFDVSFFFSDSYITTVQNVLIKSAWNFFHYSCRSNSTWSIIKELSSSNYSSTVSTQACITTYPGKL